MTPTVILGTNIQAAKSSRPVDLQNCKQAKLNEAM